MFRSCPMLTLVLAAACLVVVPTPAAAQHEEIPVLVIEEPTRTMDEDVRSRLARDLRWDVIRELLAGVDIETPRTPPTQLALTPRNPYRVPGGFIRLVSASRSNGTYAAWWQPAHPNPTGSAAIDAEVAMLVHLERMRPGYRYAIDISLQAFDPTSLDLRTCDGVPGVRLRTARVDGTGHVVIAAMTDGNGEACYHLRSTTDESIYIHKVEISEVGPVRFGR